MKSNSFLFDVNFNLSDNDLYYKKSSTSISFNPLNLPGIFAWYTTKNVLGNGTTPADNTPVSLWADLSPNSYNFSQSIGSNQPIFKRNIQSGNPGILFNSSKELLGPISLLQNITTQYTMYFVMQSFASIDAAILFAKPDDLTNRLGLVVPLALNTSVYMDFGNIFSGQRLIVSEPDIYGTTYGHCFTVSSPNMFNYRNNVLMGTNSSGGTFSPGGKTPSMGFQSSAYYIFETILCNQVHDTTTRTSVFSYLQGQWGY